MNSGVRSWTLCATMVQVGRDTETLKEPVTRWHRVAWIHLYCRDTIVAPTTIVGSTLSRQCCPFCGPWHRCLAVSTAFSGILMHPHLPNDKTNKRKKRHIPFSSLSFLIPSLPSSSSSVSVYQVSRVYVLQEERDQKQISSVYMSIVQISAIIIHSAKKYTLCFRC